MQICNVCGQQLKLTGHNQKYCKECSVKVRKQYMRKYSREYARLPKTKIKRQKYISRPEIKVKLGEHSYRHRLKQDFNMTLEQYDKMFEKQNGLCAICKLPGINIRLGVDHNHKTGKVRGLLCQKCNRRLEAVEDEDFARKAQKYLKAHQEQ